MQICYFGSYKRDYSRNSIFLKGLKLNGVEIKEVNFSTNLRNYPKSYFRTLKIQYDAILVGYSYNRRYEVFLARLSKKKPILFDALISQYDTQVFDRKIVDINSLRAKFLYYRELFTLRFADCIILDTNAHINYFKELFPLKNKNYERIFIGADDSIAVPKNISKKSNQFCVLFYGSYTPLHGIEYILKAAKELQKDKEIVFRLIGKGQMFNYVQKLKKTMKLTNLEFIPPVSYPKLIEYINISDICLGIFGITRKAANVIPNKVYDALATAKPIITGDSTAIREILTHEVNCLLCKRGNGKSLAEAIILLKEDNNLRKKIALNGYYLFKKRFTPKHIGRSLLKILYKYV